MSPEQLEVGTIKAEHIWKRFRPDVEGSMLRAEVDRLRERFGGPKLKWQWALRDISLLATPGESIGLVGDNGSGKSTLLKIICGVMYPYAGRVDVAGRVGALIEVRAGIQQELTGRENIKLYGTLLGLTRIEVMKRFDTIVAFAELQDAIDRQVKFYSSGMQMRLGFSVAAFLEPAILLVDEVLAVGDQQFQQRCLDRIREVVATGTTVVFVSHDLAAVGAITDRVIWLDRGRIAAEGNANEILAAYRNEVEARAELASLDDGLVRIRSVSIDNPEAASPVTQEAVEIRLVFESDEERAAQVYVGVTEGTPDAIFVVVKYLTLHAGITEVRIHLDSLPLPKGRYTLWVGAINDPRLSDDLVVWQPAKQFDVYGPTLDVPPTAIVIRAPVHVEATWTSAPITHWGEQTPSAASGP
jgi:ABC-type polysaccharide/polyol phosphate transport system ATPase subunit